MNSKRKGKVGELEAAAKLREVFGCPVRRGQQYKGTPDSPDVVGLPGIHVEVKRVEKLNIEVAMAQAKADCGCEVTDSDKQKPDDLWTVDYVKDVPIVMHRRNRGDWMFTICVDDIREFIRLLNLEIMK